LAISSVVQLLVIVDLTLRLKAGWPESVLRRDCLVLGYGCGVGRGDAKLARRKTKLRILLIET